MRRVLALSAVVVASLFGAPAQARQISDAHASVLGAAAGWVGLADFANPRARTLWHRGSEEGFPFNYRDAWLGTDERGRAVLLYGVCRQSCGLRERWLQDYLHVRTLLHVDGPVSQIGERGGTLAYVTSQGVFVRPRGRARPQRLADSTDRTSVAAGRRWVLVFEDSGTARLTAYDMRARHPRGRLVMDDDDTDELCGCMSSTFDAGHPFVDGSRAYWLEARSDGAGETVRVLRADLSAGDTAPVQAYPLSEASDFAATFGVDGGALTYAAGSGGSGVFRVPHPSWTAAGRALPVRY